MSMPKKFKCPYCDREAMSPGGIRFHVASDHPEKVGEFKADHYPAMAKEFK